MSALGSTALHLQIADFKFTHNFIICNQLLETELTFGIDIQKKFSLSYAWDKEKIAIYKEMVNFWFTHTLVIAQQQYEQLSQCSRYHPDTMVSYQSR